MDNNRLYFSIEKFGKDLYLYTFILNIMLNIISEIPTYM